MSEKEKELEKKGEKELEQKGEKEKDDQKLPHCTTATTAEHARASDGDEPCNDGRGGDIKE